MARPSARVWRVERLGTPEKALRLGEAPLLPPAAGHARVAVRAVGLNFPDLLLCAGRYQERPGLPFVPGFEAAGTVVDAGRTASVEPGQQVVVVPELPGGAFAESLTVPSDQLYPVPDEMPAEVAATLHVAYQTAHAALHRRANLRAGETLVVSGAAGGVGAAAVQLGVHAGARVVAVVTGAAKAAACRRWGAHEVIDLGGRPGTGGAAGEAVLAERVRAVTAGRGADVVLDVVGGGVFDQLRRAVAFEGRIVVVGFTGGAIGAVPANHVLLRNYSVLGLHLASYRREDPGHLRAVHAELVRAWRAGAVDPPIHAVLPFEDAVAGLRLLAGREAVGRVVLRTAGVTPAGPAPSPPVPRAGTSGPSPTA